MVSSALEALETAFQDRKRANEGRVRVNNASLKAGDDMFYYCTECGEEMRLPETHTGAVPKTCTACNLLQKARDDVELAIAMME